MATITKRVDTNGKPYYTAQVRLLKQKDTATFKRITDAKKWVQDTESAIREGRWFSIAVARKHTFSDLTTRYYSEILPDYNEKERKERKSKLDWWVSKIGCYALADITPSIINEHKSAMTQSAATVDKYIKNLQHAFSIAVNEWEWLSDNPVKKVKSPKLPRGRVRFLDDNERIRLLKACKESPNPLLYPCVILALSTGMRQAEQMGLVWSDVSLKEGYLILHKTKNSDRRRVTLSGVCLDLLKTHAKVRRLDSNLLFPSPRDPQKPIDLRKAFLNALEVSKVADFKWHDLRHSTASYLAMDGASLASIAEVLGHRTLSMVKRYSHLSESHVSGVVASMNAKIFGDA